MQTLQVPLRHARESLLLRLRLEGRQRGPEVKPKRVLVACEFSGIVRDAFIAEGHDAVSCDLLPTERPGPHIQGDVRPLLREPWDLVIAHPPCQFLTHASMPEVVKHPWKRFRGMVGGIEFFRACYDANAPLVAVENPMMLHWARKRVGRPDCWSQPWHHGAPYTKRTGFWLRGLPPLLPTLIAPPPHRSWTREIDAAMWSRDKRRSGLKSKTFPGMAAAMAKQWGSYLATKP